MAQPTSTTTMTTTMVKLADLTLDPQLQPRVNGVDERAWRDYAEDMSRGETLPPIRVIVGRDQQGTAHRWLVEGWHRVAAARSIGLTELPASISAGTFEQAEDEMLRSNRGHGLRRSQADVQHAIRRSLQTKKWQKRADKWIAEWIGCSDKTVTTIRGEMEAASEIPKVPKLQGKDGKHYTRREPKRVDAMPTVQTANDPSEPAEEVMTKPPSAPMPLELVDKELTDCRQMLQRVQARLTTLKAGQPGLSRAERQASRQHWIAIRRLADDVIVDLDGTHKATPTLGRSA